MVKTLLKASQINNTNQEVEYLWDLMNPLVRFLLLNRTQTKSLSFNVPQHLQQNQTVIKWINLPIQVQNLLLNQQGSALLYMSYEQWGWVDSRSIHAGVTLLSIIPNEFQNDLATMCLILAPIQFDLQINMNLLNELLSFQADKPNMDRFFNSLFGYFHSCYKSIFKRYKQEPRVKPFIQAIFRAKTFLKSIRVYYSL